MDHSGLLVVALVCASGVVACSADDDAAISVVDDLSTTEAPSATEPPLTTEAVQTTEPAPTTEVVETTQPAPTTEAVQTTEGVPSSEPATTTVPARANVLEFELVGCDRFGIGSGVDPVAARGYVLDSHELWLAGDSALFTLQTMSCADLVTEGVSHGPGHFGTAWIRVVGPDGPVALPPETDLVAQPTDSYYAPLFHTDNEAFSAVIKAFGIPITLANSMTFDPPNEGTQSGNAVDQELDPPLTYHWSVDNINRNDEGVGTGRHVLFSLDDQGAPLTYYGEFLHEPGWMGNVGTLELEPGSAFEDLIGTSLTGQVNGDAVTVTMVAFRKNA